MMFDVHWHCFDIREKDAMPVGCHNIDHIFVLKHSVVDIQREGKLCVRHTMGFQNSLREHFSSSKCMTISR